jgi:hypothetical protein
MNIPDNVLNPSLYKKAKAEADKKYKRPTSAYKSMYISKRYQEMGGKYKGKKESQTERWRKEEWVQIVPYVEKNKKIACGSQNKKNKACRPLKKVNKDTPPTMNEIVKKFGKVKVNNLAKKKNKNMKGRLNWKKGTFKPE